MMRRSAACLRDRRLARARRARAWWVTAAVGFLALVGVALWILVRTRAGNGYGYGRHEHSLEDAVAMVDAAESAPRDEIVYHSRHNDRMEIALSFDDGPHPRLTPVILDILEQYGIKATFFMVGENVGYYPTAAKAVAEAGHEIANHTFSHRKFGRMTEEEMRREILSCQEALASVGGTATRFIRPPEGQMNSVMRRVVGTLDYRISLWVFRGCLLKGSGVVKVLNICGHLLIDLLFGST